MLLLPCSIEPVPPEPPARKPPMLDCAVDGYIHSSCPVSRAACSRLTIVAPASAVMTPSPTSTTARARDMSSTRPPGIGIAWP